MKLTYEEIRNLCEELKITGPLFESLSETEPVPLLDYDWDDENPNIKELDNEELLFFFLMLFGEVELMDEFDALGDDCWIVILFKNHDVCIRFSGHMDLDGGSEYFEIEQVFPREIQTVVYETLAERNRNMSEK